MSLNGLLLKLARSVVRNIMQTIAQQVKVIESVVTQPLEAAVKTIVGPYWRGAGADRFAEEMAQSVIPNLVKIAFVTSNFNLTLGKAIDIMDQAEAKATQRASQLHEVFQKIYQ